MSSETTFLQNNRGFWVCPAMQMTSFPLWSLGEKAPGSLFILSESDSLSLSFGPFSAQLKSQVINLHLLSRLRSFALFS